MARKAPAASASGLRFDEEAARRLETMYMHPDVVERRRRVRQALALAPGERVLDVGCGPGFLTTEIVADIGAAGLAHGVDISEANLAAARARLQRQPLPNVDFREGDAVALPFPDASYDAAVATQVLEYVADLPAALAELYRVLRPGGRAVIVDTDWATMAWHATDTTLARRILDAWDDHLAHPSLPRTLGPALRQAGLTPVRTEVITVLNLEWTGYSHGLSGLVAGFVAGRHGITRDEADAWLRELRRLSEEDAYFFSLDQFLFLASKPER